jgi:hypothetical protein
MKVVHVHVFLESLDVFRVLLLCSFELVLVAAKQRLLPVRDAAAGHQQRDCLVSSYRTYVEPGGKVVLFAARLTVVVVMLGKKTSWLEMELGE